MTRKILFAFCAALLAGCAHHGHFRVPDPENPRAQVVVAPNGYLVVNQEPLVVAFKANTPTLVAWRVAPGLKFDPQGGIKIIGKVKDAEQNPIPVDTGQNGQIRCNLGDKPSETTLSALARVAPDNAGLKELAERARAAATPPDPQAFVCVVLPTIQRGHYAYSITVDQGGKLIKQDPTLMI